MLFLGENLLKRQNSAFVRRRLQVAGRPRALQGRLKKDTGLMAFNNDYRIDSDLYRNTKLYGPQALCSCARHMEQDRKGYVLN